MKKYYLAIGVLLILIIGVVLLRKFVVKSKSIPSNSIVYQAKDDTTGASIIYNNITWSDYNGVGVFQYTDNRYPWRVNGLVDNVEKIEGSDDYYVSVVDTNGKSLDKWRIRLNSGTKYETIFYLEELNFLENGVPKIIELGTYKDEKVKNYLNQIFTKGNFVAMDTANEGVEKERYGIKDEDGIYYVQQVVIRRNGDRL